MTGKITLEVRLPRELVQESCDDAPIDRRLAEVLRAGESAKEMAGAQAGNFEVPAHNARGTQPFGLDERDTELDALAKLVRFRASDPHDQAALRPSEIFDA